MVNERRSFWRELWSVLLADLPRVGIVLISIGIGFAIMLGALQLIRLLGVADRFGGAFGLAGVFIGAIVAWLALSYGTFLLGRKGPYLDTPTIQERLGVLNRTISAAVDLAAEIETELRARQRAFEDLRTKSVQLEELAKLNEQAAEAVTALVTGAVQRRGRHDLIVNSAIAFLTGVITTVLGLVVSGTVSHR